MVIAVDVCVGAGGIDMLRRAGHRVITAAHGEPDRAWMARATQARVELFVSADADVEIYAYDAAIPFVRVRQGERGEALALRIIRMLATGRKDKP